jgi:TPR repeat protein
MFGRLLPAFAALLILAAGLPAQAQSRPPGFELAEAYFRKGNFASAYLIALPVAHAGDGRAQYMLGLMSYHGLSPVTKDLKEAARWFALAARGGNPDAQFALAQAYVRGDGVNIDRPKALEWLGRAALGGQTAAIMSLARLLDEGIEVPQDRAAATAWVRHAAELGDTRAQLMLGERLAEGIGAPRDPESGNAWVERAAALGEPIALLKLARDVIADEGAQPERIIMGHAWATYAEERAEGDVKKEAAAAKGRLAARMTPTDLASAGEKLAQLRPQPK